MSRGVRNYPRTGGASAVKDGLSGLDQTGANFSMTWWMRVLADIGEGAWGHTDNGGSLRNGVTVRPNGGYKLRLTLGTGAGGANVDSVAGVLVPGRYLPYAVTYDGAAVLFYRLGSPVDRVANTTVPTAGGTRQTAVGVAGAGRINNEYFDLRIFPNKTLSAAEVRACMDPRRVVAGCKQRLFLNWQPGASSTLFDESGNGNDLTMSATLEECASAPAPNWYDLLVGRRVLKGASGSTSVSQAMTVPYEALQGVASTASLPYETLQALTAAVAAAYETLGGLAVPGNASFEALTGLIAANPIGYEVLGGLAGAIAVPFESAGRVAAAVGLSYEALQQLAGAGAIPFDAVQGILAGQVVAFETLGGIAIAVPLPYEVTGQTTPGIRVLILGGAQFGVRALGAPAVAVRGLGAAQIGVVPA